MNTSVLSAFQEEANATTIHSVQPKNPCDPKPAQFISDSGKRSDGRLLDQFRNVFMKTGLVKRASGSAYVEVNHTKVICSVYGPKQLVSEFSERGRLQCDYQVATFATLDKRKQTNYDDYGVYMNEALEASVCLDKIPKSVIDVNILVLEDDGSALSTAITCASLALADAGVEMFDLVSGCTASEIDSQVVVDPCKIEERFSTGGVICSYMASLNEITQLTQQGDMQYQKVVEAVELCVDGCTKIHELMKKTLQQSTT